MFENQAEKKHGVFQEAPGITLKTVNSTSAVLNSDFWACARKGEKRETTELCGISDKKIPSVIVKLKEEQENDFTVSMVDGESSFQQAL